MSGPKTYQICDGCGAWRQVRNPSKIHWLDYETALFAEEHVRHCPVTGRRENMLFMREDDPQFLPLPAEDEWHAETHPDYRPQRRPRFCAFERPVFAHLVGLWIIDGGPGSNYMEDLKLDPDGSARVDLWHGGIHAGEYHFRWHFTPPALLVFEGGDSYFPTEQTRFEIGTWINTRGFARRILKIYDRGEDQQPQIWLRALDQNSPAPVLNHKVPAFG